MCVWFIHAYTWSYLTVTHRDGFLQGEYRNGTGYGRKSVAGFSL